MNAKRFANTWSDVGWVKALKNNVNVVVSPIASNGVKFVEEVKDVLGRDDAARMGFVEAFGAALLLHGSALTEAPLVGKD